MKPRIMETVIVEGRDDEAAVLAAVDACVICTNGYGIRQSILELIESASRRRGIIILTDPDHAGESIRRKLSEKFPGAKHAYIAKNDAARDGELGVENAPPSSILKALEAAGAVGSVMNSSGFQPDDAENIVSRRDMFQLGLEGGVGSAELRARVGSSLGIGSANAKTFKKRLNAFGIGREELVRACERSRRERP